MYSSNFMRSYVNVIKEPGINEGSGIAETSTRALAGLGTIGLEIGTYGAGVRTSEASFADTAVFTNSSRVNTSPLIILQWILFKKLSANFMKELIKETMIVFKKIPITAPM